MLEVLLHKTRSRDIGHMNFGYKKWNNKALNPNKATQSEARFIENKDTTSWK